MDYPAERIENLVNRSGILSTDTWPFYKRNFGCSNFKGTWIENNFYLLRPIFLNSGVVVNSRRKFLLARQENQLFEGLDFIISDQFDAIIAAKLLYLPLLVEPDEGISFLNKYNLTFVWVVIFVIVQLLASHHERTLLSMRERSRSL